MFVFKTDDPEDGWAPMIHTTCPSCKGKVGFYTLLASNQCKVCRAFMPTLPNIGSIAKSQVSRIVYHVFDDVATRH